MAIERPDGRLVDALLEAGHPVMPVKPNAIKIWREAEVLSGAKSDPGDAAVIADRHCATPLGTSDADLTAAAVVVHDDIVVDALPGTRAGASAYVEEDLVFRSYRCPGCGTQLRPQIVPRNEPASMR